ncbi:MAG: matrixin family metalloprotease [Nitrospirota bacterium]
MTEISKKTFLNVSIVVVTIAVLTLLAHPVFASTLDLLGIGWNKSEVTVLIKPAKGVTSQAVADVETAISDWNNAVQGIAGAPYLTIMENMTARDKKADEEADIVIHMKVGGGAVLGYALPKTISPFSCVLKSVRIQLSGKAFGENLSSAGIRNVARHELGHAFGVGHCDDPKDLMYATADSSEIFGNSDVYIADCDINGIDAVYPLPVFCTLPDSVACL